MKTKTVLTLLLAADLAAQGKLPPPAQRTFADPATFVPDLAEAAATSELRDVVPRYAADRQLLQRFYTVSGSAERNAALRALPKIDFDRLSQEGRVDYVLLLHRIESDLRLVDCDERLWRAIAPGLKK